MPADGVEERVSALEQRAELDRRQYQQILRLVSTNTADIAAIRTDIAAIRTEIAALKNDIRALQLDIANLRVDLSDIVIAAVDAAMRRRP